MPILRKIVKIGNSKGISFPKSWIDCIEQETGRELKEVLVEIDNNLIVSPRIRGEVT